MLYRVYAFDGLEVPAFRQREQNDDMGTGDALSSYKQLPNGFFDNYGTSRSPRNVRPIVHEGELHDTTHAALRAQLLAWRGKLGVRGKLTVRFADGALYWQWARLMQVQTPSNMLTYLSAPIVLIWESAGQIWYGIIASPDEWAWGDLTWTFGDGTAEFGENGTSETLTATGATGTAPPSGGTTQTVDITHNGNIEATNLALTFTAGTTAITAVKISNDTTGENFYFSASVSAGNILSVDCGAMSITNNGSNAYSSFTPSNRARWMTLAPGENSLTITVNGNTAQDGTFGVEFYDHYS